METKVTIYTNSGEYITSQAYRNGDAYYDKDGNYIASTSTAKTIDELA